MGEVFLDNDGIVSVPSVRDEAGLGRANDVREEGLDSVDNNFSNKLVSSIT